MKAKNAKHYVEQWKSHTAQIIYVALDADDVNGDWKKIENDLHNLIEKAAGKLVASGDIPNDGYFDSVGDAS